MVWTLTKPTLPILYDNLIRLVWWNGTKHTDQRNNSVISLDTVFVELTGKVSFPDFAKTSSRFGEHFAYELLHPQGRHEYTYGIRVNSQNMLNDTITLLQRSPETRRTVIPIYNTYDVFRTCRNKEVPCATQIIIQKHKNRLDFTVTMRSNDIVNAFPSDVYGFAKLQQYVAQQTGIKVGKYKQYIENAHIILDNDEDFVRKHVIKRPL